nr:unnamed protein product [Callosobruchus chinensis]
MDNIAADVLKFAIPLHGNSGPMTNEFKHNQYNNKFLTCQNNRAIFLFFSFIDKKRIAGQPNSRLKRKQQLSSSAIGNRIHG